MNSRSDARATAARLGASSDFARERRRLGGRGELVGEDPLLVDAVLSDQHLLGRLDHRRRPAHVHVGLRDLPFGQIAIDRVVDKIVDNRGEAEVAQGSAEVRDFIRVEQVPLGTRAVKEANRPRAPLRDSCRRTDRIGAMPDPPAIIRIGRSPSRRRNAP